MKSIINEGKTINSFMNEALALGLFAVGFFVLKVSKNLKKSKLTSTEAANLILTPNSKKEDKFSSTEEYNDYIENFLLYKPNLNPIDLIKQMESEGISPNFDTFFILINVCLKQKNKLFYIFQIYDCLKKSNFFFFFYISFKFSLVFLFIYFIFSLFKFI